MRPSISDLPRSASLAGFVPVSPEAFVHLHVASGYSLRYGASHPHTLVERAVEHEMDILALTDRDGTYGAVKFAKACRAAQISPVLGVDLALDLRGGSPSDSDGAFKAAPGRAPVRGGAFRQEPPRITLLAQGRAGWAAICRATSAVHLSGERGRPLASPEILAPFLAGGEVIVMFGPTSPLGLSLAQRGDAGAYARAEAALRPWREILDSRNVVIEALSHRSAGASAHAARLVGFAREAGLVAVLTNAVRYADRVDAPVSDVLDASRRLVVLSSRHVDRVNAEGFLKSGPQMREVADEITRLAGHNSQSETRRLLAATRSVAQRCVLDPRADLGIGEIHFPEFEPTLTHRGSTLPGSRTAEPAAAADHELRLRCEAGISRRYGAAPRQRIWKRLDDELRLIAGLGYASYFLTVGDITDLIRERGVRCAARGSGAGSLVNYLLGISGVDPIRHDLLMERFLSPLRSSLPDIDLDVESARRLEIYEAILDRYGGERCVCVSMMDTYRVRHAVRDAGAALGMPPTETDAIAKAFPHIRARDARLALRELPELRASGLAQERLDLLFRLVEKLDGLPRHIAMHPCGVLLSDATLLDRTPVESSFGGYPMSQFDKDDVEDLGLLKLDVLGIRMQSAMAHAVAEIRRVDGVEIDLDDEAAVPFDDDDTYAMISAARTLGVFQIESPGQRELVGKSGIESFSDIITDISLFRPGPVKSDMITPYLEVKQGWRTASYFHPDLVPILRGTHGVVVFHEQVIEMIAQFAGVSYAEGDEKRRALGDHNGMAATRAWFVPRALARGYGIDVVEEIWKILEAFASFGFCKAHAAAFALPTFQSAWLKAHWPAHFLSGVLTHDPGMYPKRLILDDARHFGIGVRGLDVNVSGETFTVEDSPEDKAGYAIRLALTEVKGINLTEVRSIVAARPYASLGDFFQRTQVSRPVIERLILAGGFDTLYRINTTHEISRKGRVTRRDLLLQTAELERFARALHQGQRVGRGRGLAARPPAIRGASRAAEAAQRNSSDPRERATDPPSVWARSSAQSRASAAPRAIESVQLALALGDEPDQTVLSGLPEVSAAESLAAELEILGLDVSGHVIDQYSEFLTALGVTRSRDLLSRRSRAELLVAGVKVATQTPPIRSGRRVIFLTLDDATGPVDATFFEDAQGPYAATVFGSWLLLVRGELRRTGRRGVSVRATGAWALPELHQIWREASDRESGLARVRQVLDSAATGGSASAALDSPGQRRVLVHSSGFRMSPYADIRPAGDDPSQVSRALWHRSPGSPG